MQLGDAERFAAVFHVARQCILLLAVIRHLAEPRLDIRERLDHGAAIGGDQALLFGFGDVAFRVSFPPSKIVCSRLAPMPQPKLDPMNSVPGATLDKPPLPVSEIAGKNAARAASTLACALARLASACATSGRRCKKVDGRPGAIGGV